MSYVSISADQAQKLYRLLRNRVSKGLVPLNHAIPLDPEQPDSPMWTLKDFCDVFGLDISYKRLQVSLARKALGQVPLDHPSVPALRAFVGAHDKEMAAVRLKRFRNKSMRQTYKEQLAAVQPVQLGGVILKPKPE